MLYTYNQEDKPKFDTLNQTHVFFDKNGTEIKDEEFAIAFTSESNGIQKYFVKLVGGSLFDKNRDYMRGLTHRFAVVDAGFFEQFLQYLKTGTPAVHLYLKNEFMMKGF